MTGKIKAEDSDLVLLLIPSGITFDLAEEKWKVNMLNIF